MALLRDGDQLLLELDWGREPWQGRSPRLLTKAGLALFSRQKPPCHEVFFDPEQLEFWPVDGATLREGPPPIRVGAPLVSGVLPRRSYGQRKA